jgi:putative peptidoglycan lipid II flippase
MASGLAPVAYNSAIIGGALLLAGPFGIAGVAVAVVVGAAAHLAIQLPQLLGRLRRIALDLRDPAVYETLLLLLPRALGLGAIQVVFLVNTSVASVIGPGAVSVYSVAFTIFQIPVGLIGLPLGIVLLPSLSAAQARGAGDRYHELLERSLRLLLFVMLPLSLAMAVLAEPLVRLLVGYGRFDPAAVERTAVTLQAFLLALTPEALVAVLARAFYARRDTRRPVAVALAAVALDVPAAVILAGLLGTPGLALAIGLAAWLEVGLLGFWLTRLVPGFHPGPILRAGVGHLGGALLVGAVVLAADLGLVAALGSGFGGPVAWLARGALASAAGVVAYVTYARLRGCPELAELRPLLPTRLASRWPAGGGPRP